MKGKLDEESRRALIKYRLQRAEQTLDEAKVMYEIPIAYGFRAGDDGVNWPLIEECPVTLTATTDRTALTF